MTWLPVAAGAVVALAAAVAVGARGTRPATLGLLAALVFSPFAADPVPPSAELGFRVAAGVLAAFLLLVAGRGADEGGASPLGLPATLAGAAAAFAAGLGATAVGIPAFGTTAALAAGLATLVVALSSVGRTGDPFRLGIALVLLLDAGLLIRASLVGTPPGLEALVAGGSLVALAAAVLALAGAGARAGAAPEVQGRPAASAPERVLRRATRVPVRAGRPDPAASDADGAGRPRPSA
ncbi:MAG: hypothetical protein M0T75_09980 [Chloroflexi bacterium]|nr:hypothetical protein [Chloroflexota bacterium]